jgi:hypothetical protein
LATSPLRLTTSNYILQLNTCGYSPHVTSSLRGEWVFRLQLLLVLASAVILRSESRGTHDHILLSQIRDSPNLEGEVPPEQGGPVITPGTGFPFRRLLRLLGLRWMYSTPPPHGRHRKHRFQQFYCCVTQLPHGLNTEHRFPVSSLVESVAQQRVYMLQY